MSTAIIPELSYLLQVVEKTYGRKLYTTTDFESLSIIIENKIGELISSSTLKRLYGYVSMKPVPRKSTLDVLSRFIGYRSFEDFRSDLRTNPKFSSTYFSAKMVCAASLDRGSRVRIGWMPDRVVSLSYLGDDTWRVDESLNSQLQAGDRFQACFFMLGYPLYLSSIERDVQTTPAYIAGTQGGLNLLEVL